MRNWTLEREREAWCVQHMNTEGGYQKWWGPSLLQALDRFAHILSFPRCLECGDPAIDEYMEDYKTRIRETRLCFSCLFWADCHRDSGPSAVVVKGVRYNICPDQPKGYRGFLGYDGAEFRIRFNDGREVVSHNLWCRGTVPDHFKARIPDNAEFVR